MSKGVLFLPPLITSTPASFVFASVPTCTGLLQCTLHDSCCNQHACISDLGERSVSRLENSVLQSNDFQKGVGKLYDNCVVCDLFLFSNIL